MDDLSIATLEGLCEALYNSASPEERNAAGNRLYSILEDPEHFRRLFALLNLSAHPQLLYLALSSLCKALPSQWKKLDPEEQNALYSSVLALLLQGEERPGFVYGGISKALARVCRLAWVQSPSAKTVVESCKRALEQNFYLSEVVIKFFRELIQEMTEPVRHRTTSINRKTAVLFRDEALLSIFEYILLLLGKVAELPPQVIVPLLNVTVLCLSFDFLGVTSDETSDDSVCLQIPIAWKRHFEDPVVLEYLKFIVVKGAGEHETLALRCLNHLGAVRKSLFSGTAETKQRYLARYLAVLCEIMQNKQLEGDSLFEFMQLSRRFVSNFTLREVAENTGFPEWIALFCNYTCLYMSKPEALTSGYVSGFYV